MNAIKIRLVIFVGLLGLAVIFFIFLYTGSQKESDLPWYVGKWSGINTYNDPNLTLGLLINPDNSVTGCMVIPGTEDVSLFSGSVLENGGLIMWADGTPSDIIKNGSQLQLGADDVVIYTKPSKKDAF